MRRLFLIVLCSLFYTLTQAGQPADNNEVENKLGVELAQCMIGKLEKADNPEGYKAI